MVFQSLVMILPRFFDFERPEPNCSPSTWWRDARKLCGLKGTPHVDMPPLPASSQKIVGSDSGKAELLNGTFINSNAVNSGPSLPKARHKPERRGGGKTGMIDVNGKNNKVEQKNNKKIKTMGDVTLKGYDMTNTVTKGTGVRVHKQ